jgi:hypothetical protein
LRRDAGENSLERGPRRYQLLERSPRFDLADAPPVLPPELLEPPRALRFRIGRLRLKDELLDRVLRLIGDAC